MLLGKLLKVVAVEATVLAGVYVYKNYGKLCKSIFKDVVCPKPTSEDINLSTPEEDMSKSTVEVKKSVSPKAAVKKPTVKKDKPVAAKKATAKVKTEDVVKVTPVKKVAAKKSVKKPTSDN